MTDQIIFIDKRLYIGSSLIGGGYGVFTNSFIEKNTIVEGSHIIKISNDEIAKLIYAGSNGLYDYIWLFEGEPVLALGFGSIYNHADTPNLDVSFLNNTIQFKTNVDIYPNNELFVTYGEPWWFIRNKTPKTM